MILAVAKEAVKNEGKDLLRPSGRRNRLLQPTDVDANRRSTENHSAPTVGSSESRVYAEAILRGSMVTSLASWAMLTFPSERRKPSSSLSSFRRIEHLA